MLHLQVDARSVPVLYASESFGLSVCKWPFSTDVLDMQNRQSGEYAIKSPKVPLQRSCTQQILKCCSWTELEMDVGSYTTWSGFEALESMEKFSISPPDKCAVIDQVPTSGRFVRTGRQSPGKYRGCHQQAFI